MKLVDLEQNTPEWHQFREGKIGASLAPVIMGVSPWMTPYQLYEEMMGTAPKRAETDAMRRGRALEERARQRFIQQTGVEVVPGVGVHDKFDWLFASFDGICTDNKMIVEIKCPGKEDHDTALSGKVPEKYYPQVQHQLAVSGYTQAHYYSFTEQSTALVIVPRNEDYILKMVKEEYEFYKCLLNFTPPKLTERDYIQRSDTAWRELAEELGALLEQKEALEAREVEIKQALRDLSEGKNSKGFGVAFYKTTRKGNVDYAKIPELEGVNLEQYRKDPSEVWTVRRVQM